jgi:hypothetical protein
MSRRPLYLLFGLTTFVASFVACSADPDGGTFDDDTSGSGDPSGSGASTSVSTSDGVGGNFTTTSVGTGGNSGNTCSTPANVDDDGDGFSEDDGDCNDCDANTNPGAIEVVDDGQGGGEPADEDCDGAVDNAPAACDSALALTDFDPVHGAQAIELCQTATAGDKKWGVLEADYVRADGSNISGAEFLQAGIFDKFGTNVNVQGGSRMLGISSGYARRVGDDDACNDYSCYTNFGGTAPPGFPQDVPNCTGDTAINDDIALQLKVRSPKNATGYKFAFKFYSFEFPEYVCTSFNDQFIALVTPNPAGSINGNVSFDSAGNPVSVNVAYFDVCDPSGIGNYGANCFGCVQPPQPYCPLGTGELVQTGFEPSWGEDAGGTSWLQTQAPVTGGDEITIRFAIWDTGDTAWDSTALIDNFQWIANGGTVAIGTVPVEDPK